MSNLAWATDKYSTELKKWNALTKTVIPSAGRPCLPCYSARKEDSGITCCNNCHQLQTAYLKSGLSIEETKNYPQVILTVLIMIINFI